MTNFGSRWPLKNVLRLARYGWLSHIPLLLLRGPFQRFYANYDKRVVDFRAWSSQDYERSLREHGDELLSLKLGQRHRI